MRRVTWLSFFISNQISAFGIIKEKTSIMTRLLFLLFAFALSAAQCEADIDPELSKLDGKWKLFKIGIGYPLQNGPTELVPTETETLEIDTKAATLIRTVNGVVTESTKIEIGKQPKSSSNPRLALIFLESKTYSFLSIDEQKGEISLYQKSFLDAEIADGNTFFYKKQ
jgi:hypothetical protein